jgi:hypothetical protein
MIQGAWRIPQGRTDDALFCRKKDPGMSLENCLYWTVLASSGTLAVFGNLDRRFTEYSLGDDNDNPAIFVSHNVGPVCTIQLQVI